MFKASFGWITAIPLATVPLTFILMNLLLDVSQAPGGSCEQIYYAPTGERVDVKYGYIAADVEGWYWDCPGHLVAITLSPGLLNFVPLSVLLMKRNKQDVLTRVIAGGMGAVRFAVPAVLLVTDIVHYDNTFSPFAIPMPRGDLILYSLTLWALSLLVWLLISVYRIILNICDPD